MPLRNGEHGYGVVTKVLHWLTFSVIVGQFLVGYSMSTAGRTRSTTGATTRSEPRGTTCAAATWWPSRWC